MRNITLFLIILTNLFSFQDFLDEKSNMQQNNVIDTMWSIYNTYKNQEKQILNTEEMRTKKIQNQIEKRNILRHKELQFLYPQQQELYPFTLYNSNLNYFSMEQANQILINSTIFLGNRISNYTETIWSKVLLNLFFNIGYELTLDVWAHEEGHRSILSYHNIKSRNQWIDGEVDHVKTSTLNYFKRDNFIDFIRLHTAGIESEAVAIDAYNEALIFENHDFLSIAMRLWILKFINYSYISSTDKGDGMHDESENFNELLQDEYERDIVGHDVYGFVYHLFNKNDILFIERYKNIDDFTVKEREYHTKITKRAWLNFIDSNLLYLIYKNLKTATIKKMGFWFNYYLTPFGDVTDFNFSLNSQVFKGRFVLRQMRNYNNKFYALVLKDYRRKFKNFWVTTVLNIWENPKNFDFFTNQSFLGGSIEINLEYKINHILNLSTKILSKTKGFLPGINDNNLQSMNTLSFGIVFKY